MTARILPYGPRALLAEYQSIEEVMIAAARLRRIALPTVQEIVPAARTVLVMHDGSDTSALRALLAEERPAELPPALQLDQDHDHDHGRWIDGGDEIHIPVRYDGVDLGEISELTGLSVDSVIDLHAGAVYTVAFCGFVPGFAYLVGLPRELLVPRRSSPRTRVEAGSVAIAGEWASVYPSVSPGGWRLLGHTDVAMWDETREIPALLVPGRRVRFEPK